MNDVNDNSYFDTMTEVEAKEYFEDLEADYWINVAKNEF